MLNTIVHHSPVEVRLTILTWNVLGIVARAAKVGVS